MRIIIEIDSNNQTEIKNISTGSSGDSGSNMAMQAVPVDAGVANIPVSVENNDTSGSDIENEFLISSTKATNITGIDAGGYGTNQTSDDNTKSNSAHDNDLAIAVASGAALDAGAPTLTGTEWAATITGSSQHVSEFDRSDALSAGEFRRVDG